MNAIQIIVDVLMAVLGIGMIALTVKRGFVKSFFKSTKFILVILITIILGSSLTGVFEEAFVGGWFDGKISAPLAERVEESGETLGADAIIDELPDIVVKIIPADKIREYAATAPLGGAEAAREIGTKIEGTLSYTVASVMSYAAVLVISFVICSLLAVVLDRIFKLPVLNAVNKIMGFLLGTAYAYVALSVAVCIAYLILGADLIEGTLLTRVIYAIGLFTH